MEILRSAWVYDFDCEQLRHTHTPWEGQEERGGGGMGEEGEEGGREGEGVKRREEEGEGQKKRGREEKNYGQNIDQT